MDGYEISTDPARLDRALIHRWLDEESYWARGRTRAVMDRAIDNSLAFGAYAPDGAQAGFGRLVTDRAIFAYIADVFVLAEHRGRGLGVALVQAMLDHPEVATVRQFHLGTADAHALYARFGFTAGNPDLDMILRRPSPEAGSNVR